MEELGLYLFTPPNQEHHTIGHLEELGHYLLTPCKQEWEGNAGRGSGGVGGLGGHMSSTGLAQRSGVRLLWPSGQALGW